MRNVPVDRDGAASFWSRRLLETQRWCVLRPEGLSPARRFRSEELDPACFFELPEHAASVRRAETGDAILEEPTVVSRVAERRAELLAQFGATDVQCHGRVAVYHAGRNLLDRLAYDETAGFIDYSDCPGWDTWIGLLYGEPDNAGFPGISDCLAFWVPAKYEWVIAAANAVCSCSTLGWLDEESPGDICPAIRRVLSSARV